MFSSVGWLFVGVLSLFGSAWAQTLPVTSPSVVENNVSQAAAQRKGKLSAILSILLEDAPTIVEPSTPPVMGNIPDQSATVGAAIVPLNTYLYVTQTDGDSITSFGSSGTLPPGLAMNITTGVISGTPTAVGIFSFTVTAIDKDGVSNADTVLFSIVPAGPSSYALIDAAEAAGTLNHEQALLYKLYRDFKYPGLPPQYQGNDSSTINDAVSLLTTYIEQIGGINNLSIASQDALLPFLVPPYFEGSWWHRRQDFLASQANTAAGRVASLANSGVLYCRKWAEVCSVLGNWSSSTGTKVRVWYLTDWASVNKPEADALVTEIERSGGIWEKLTTLMGRQPLVETDRGNRLDVILDDWMTDPRNNQGTTQANSWGCRAQASTIYLNRFLPRNGLFSQAAHEFMHAIQLSYNSQTCPLNHKTIHEATAVWATHYMYPQGIGGIRWEVVQNYAASYLENVGTAYDERPSDLFRYGAYVFPLYMEGQAGFGPDIVKKIWEMTESNNGDLVSIDAAIKSKDPSKSFDTVWPKFAAANFSHEPSNYLLTMQGLKSYELTSIAEDFTDSGFSGTGWVGFSVDLPHASMSFHRMTFSQLDTRNLMIVNGISYKATSEAYPLIAGKVIYSSLLSDDERRGAGVQMLFKVNGTWLTDTVNVTNAQLPLTICRDNPQTRVDEIVFIYSNAEINSAKPNYQFLRPRGVSPGIHITNIGCRQWTGSIDLTTNTGLGNVTEELFSTTPIVAETLTFWDSIVPGPEPGPYDTSVDHVSMSGAAPIYFVSGNFRWTRNGTYTSGSDTCTQAGTQDFTMSARFPVGAFGNMVVEGASNHATQVISFPSLCSTSQGCIDAQYTDSCYPGVPISSFEISGMGITINLADSPPHMVSSNGLSVSGTGAQANNPSQVTGTWSFNAQTR